MLAAERQPFSIFLFSGADILNKRLQWRIVGGLMAAALLLQAETIDRIAVAVGNRVITTSDIERQIRVSAFLSGAKPDLSAEARRKTAEAMVDQKLIRGELEANRYP